MSHYPQKCLKLKKEQLKTPMSQIDDAAVHANRFTDIRRRGKTSMAVAKAQHRARVC